MEFTAAFSLPLQGTLPVKLRAFVKMTLIALLLPATFFLWARPGLSSGELSPFVALLGVALATAAPVIILHFVWRYLSGPRTR